jgi:hypothetical protein
LPLDKEGGYDYRGLFYLENYAINPWSAVPKNTLKFYGISCPPYVIEKTAMLDWG